MLIRAPLNHCCLRASLAGWQATCHCLQFKMPTRGEAWEELEGRLYREAKLVVEYIR